MIAPVVVYVVNGLRIFCGDDISQELSFCSLHDLLYIGFTISYCCEIWGNTYKTRVQPPYIIQKRAIRICNHIEYRSHTKPGFLKLNTLTIADLVKFKSMVLMYKIYNNLMPSNILSYFCMVHMSHDRDTRQAGHFKNMYCRTTLKSMCLSIRGPVMWNKLHSDLKNSTTVNMFKKRYKTFLVSEYEAT